MEIHRSLSTRLLEVDKSYIKIVAVSEGSRPWKLPRLPVESTRYTCSIRASAPSCGLLRFRGHSPCGMHTLSIELFEISSPTTDAHC